MPNNTIADNLQRLVNAKNDIADAIVAKGGTVNEGDGLEDFADDIDTIPSGGGDSHFASNLVVTTEPGAVVTATRVNIQLNVKAASGAPITITDGFTTFTGTGTGDWQVFLLPNTETWVITSMVGENISTIRFDVVDETTQSFDFVNPTIYGVTWDGSSSTQFTRTGASENFDSPVAYMADGQHPGYSPFDNISPWKDMKIVEKDGNSLVEIPKFYCKIEKNGSSMNFQISQYNIPGFYVSPAHMDRNDGYGERDFVYIGRYHCYTDYMSKTGVRPKSNSLITTSRTEIHALGEYYWQSDYAMYMTIRVLYLVEFADWNSQAVIGRGCGDGSIAYMGYTDLMPYHTGTMKTKRDSSYSSTQYRYIEGLWDNVEDLCDGVYIKNGYNVYIIKTPSDFSDETKGVYVGDRYNNSSGYIKEFTISEVPGYEWCMLPTYGGGSGTTYVTDSVERTSAAATVLAVGSDCSYSDSKGLFYTIIEISSSTPDGDAGCRLMYLPPNNS